MEPDFWHERWASNQIGFHEGETNALLEAHFNALALAPGSRVFLPLCGKTRDIAWLLGHGYRVAGAELSQTAIEQLFDELGVTPQITDHASLRLYSAPNIDIFVGDFFDITTGTLGSVDAVYDRAALVALPEKTRPRYAAHLSAITRAAQQFLITFTYDQSEMDGPPFSVPEEEVKTLYARKFTVRHEAERDLSKNLKGIVPATEDLWILQPR